MYNLGKERQAVQHLRSKVFFCRKQVYNNHRTSMCSTFIFIQFLGPNLESMIIPAEFVRKLILLG